MPPPRSRVALLARISVAGASALIGAQVFRFALQLCTLALLARLLRPEDFGLLAMAAVALTFLQQLQGLGVGTYVIQRPTLGEDERDAAFALALLGSLVCAASLLALSPLVGGFYGEPRVTAITAGLSLGLLLGGAGHVHLALMERELQFTQLARIQVAALLAASLCAVAIAYVTRSPWALVGQALTETGVVASGAWWKSRSRPALRLPRQAARSILGFGVSVVASGLVAHVLRNVDDLLIGRVWGAGALGLYNRAYGLLTTPLRQVNGPVARVAVVALSQLQDDPSGYRALYLRALNATAWLTIPLSCLMIALADEIVALVLGPGWEPAAEIFRLLALSGTVQPIGNTAGWIYTSLGQVGRMLRWSCVFGVFVVAAIVAGLPWGPNGVALGYALAVLALIYPILRVAYARSPVRVSDAVAAVTCPMLGGVLLGGVAYGIAIGAADSGPLLRSALSILGGLFAVALLVLSWGSARSEVARLVAAARHADWRRAVAVADA